MQGFRGGCFFDAELDNLPRRGIVTNMNTEPTMDMIHVANQLTNGTKLTETGDALISALLCLTDDKSTQPKKVLRLVRCMTRDGVDAEEMVDILTRCTAKVQ